MKAISKYEMAMESEDENLITDAIMEMEENSAWDFESKVKTILTQLNINHLEQPVSKLSGGQRKRVSLAKTLIQIGFEPKHVLLLMDEPSAGLAPVVVQQVFGLVKRIREEGYTVLIVEQNVQQVLKVADRAYLMEAGQLIESGNSADLLASEGVRKAYMGL